METTSLLVPALITVNLLGTIAVLMVSLIYTILFLRKAVWTEYSWIKTNLAIMQTAFICAYTYESIKFLIYGEELAGAFGAIIIRTLFFGLSVCLMLASTARYNTLLHGGEQWLLKKSKSSLT